MTLLKRFMAWGIGLTPTANGTTDPIGGRDRSPSPQFRALALRLLSSYLGAMGVVVGTLTVVVYQVVAHTLYQRVDEHLAVLADAAAHELPTIVYPTPHRRDSDQFRDDDDGDLDLPWQNLQQERQSIEWFDPQRRPLAAAGHKQPQVPLRLDASIQQTQTHRILTVPVYSQFESLKTLIGYVRVSETILEEQEELQRLLTGMEFGGLAAVVVMGATGWWLTRRSLHPIERSFAQLKQFTADASHELRSPLTAIRTAVEVMQSHPERIHPADVKKLDAIADSTQQMTQLVEDLLLLARADANSRPSLTQRSLPLDELLDDLVEMLQSQATAKQITLRLEPLAPVWVKGEASQLRRVFINLIENAIQYTPSGGTVAVTMLDLNDSHDRVLIQVNDTGIGIAREQLPRVFDRFWRADQARHRRVGGSGLGLAIAQSIVRSHGGEITVSSQLNEGSCFQVDLPVADPN